MTALAAGGTLPVVLREYLPAIVFLALGAGVGVAFTVANAVLGPRRPGAVKQEPYESGLPSDIRAGFRFPVSYYMVGMMFIVFDIEVILLFPVATVIGQSAAAAAALAVFILFLAIAFVYEWGTGSLDWDDDRPRP